MSAWVLTSLTTSCWGGGTEGMSLCTCPRTQT